MGVWRCATLTWGNPTLPSPLTRFTSEFEMGSGGTVSLRSPDINWLFRRLGKTLTNSEKRYHNQIELRTLALIQSPFYVVLSHLQHHASYEDIWVLYG